MSAVVQGPQGGQQGSAKGRELPSLQLGSTRVPVFAAAADRAGQGTAAVARASAAGSCLAIAVLPGFPPARRSPRMGRPTPTHG